MGLKRKKLKFLKNLYFFHFFGWPTKKNRTISYLCYSKDKQDFSKFNKKNLAYYEPVDFWYDHRIISLEWLVKYLAKVASRTTKIIVKSIGQEKIRGSFCVSNVSWAYSYWGSGLLAMNFNRDLKIKAMQITLAK